MSLSALNPALWQPRVQDYLNNILVGKDICNTQYSEELAYGDTINFPSTFDPYVQSVTPGVDMTLQTASADQSQMLIDQYPGILIPITEKEERQAKAKYAQFLMAQIAFRLANTIDQKVLSTGITNAYNYDSTATGTTLGVGDAYPLVANARSALHRNNATDGEMFGVVTPEAVALFSQSFVANGFRMADINLENSFTGEANGFRIYASNNLPTKNTLKITVQPADGDTVSVMGVKFTFKTTLTPLAGEVLIGGSLGAAQVNLIHAISHDTAGTNYVQLSTADRNLLLNNLVAATAFGAVTANTTTITGTGKLNLVAKFSTSANVVVGTEVTNFIFGRMASISLGMQIEPHIQIEKEPRQPTYNIMATSLFGTAVFSRDQKRLYTVAVNQ